MVKPRLPQSVPKSSCFEIFPEAPVRCTGGPEEQLKRLAAQATDPKMSLAISGQFGCGPRALRCMF